MEIANTTDSVLFARYFEGVNTRINKGVDLVVKEAWQKGNCLGIGINAFEIGCSGEIVLIGYRSRKC